MGFGLKVEGLGLWSGLYSLLDFIIAFRRKEVILLRSSSKPSSRLYWGNIGIMEKKMETTIWGLGLSAGTRFGV